MICDGCFDDHFRLCGFGGSGLDGTGLDLASIQLKLSAFDLASLHAKAGAAWALFNGAFTKGRELPVQMLKLAADAGHPNACYLLSAGYGGDSNGYAAFLDNLPIDISSAAKYAERALVLDPDTYIGESQSVLEEFLCSLVKDGRMQEASKMAALLTELDGYIFSKAMLFAIEKSTFGPFYDQTPSASSGELFSSKPSTILSVDFLSQRAMSPEEIRLADY